jgi:SAM-dependent methyltransferase
VATADSVLVPSPVLDGCNAGALSAFAMLAGMKLDVFTPLGAGPLTGEELAAELGAGAHRLRPLLFALASLGLLRVESDGRFANTEEADHYLVRGHSHFIGDEWLLLDELWRGAMLSAESTRAGRPLAAHDFGTMSAVELGRFFQGLHPETLLAGEKLCVAVDMGRHRHVLDVGGGSGGLSIALCRRFPGLRATVVELPSVTPIATAYVREAGLSERIEVRAADILAGPLEGTFDAALFRAVIQVLSEGEAGKALTHARATLSPGGSVYILGQILDDGIVRPLGAALMNLAFFSLYEHGRAYTERPYHTWLSTAGFIDVERRLPSTGLSMMLARVPTNAA